MVEAAGDRGNAVLLHDPPADVGQGLQGLHGENAGCWAHTQSAAHGGEHLRCWGRHPLDIRQVQHAYPNRHAWILCDDRERLLEQRRIAYRGAGDVERVQRRGVMRQHLTKSQDSIGRERGKRQGGDFGVIANQRTRTAGD